MTAGMNAAILAMLGITFLVLAGISGMFFYIWRRMKQRQCASNELFVNEHGILQQNKDKGVVEWNTI